MVFAVTAFFLRAPPFLFFTFFAAVAHALSPISVCALDALAWKATLREVHDE